MDYYCFPANLKLYRQRKNMTQTQLAQKLGLARNTLSDYETGVRYPSVDKVYDIARILGISAMELLENRESSVGSTVEKNF